MNDTIQIDHSIAVLSDCDAPWMRIYSIASFMMNDRCGGIFASQVIRLTGNIYSQTMRI
ncbi:hypothetical protein [Colwellia sp. PAMC 20917]|uniref:hypothetical protein n=1 Tax=Colwellia sp. PAMC 20917 TaxID=1816218 RepID=UPI0012FAFBAA|nr:hypothetical protein [Colwellia sp. PAMC 20917]